MCLCETDSDMCLCETDSETPFHVILYCPICAEKRQQLVNQLNRDGFLWPPLPKNLIDNHKRYRVSHLKGE
jgi:hypothetical protein